MCVLCFFFFFFKQKTAYEIKECDWSSDVCSSDLYNPNAHGVMCYVLHDDSNLYCAAKIISDNFDFDQIETFQHRKDSFEIRLNDLLITVSKNKSGGLYFNTIGFRYNSEKEITGSVKMFDDISESPDIANLNIDNNAKLKSVFFEVKIPFKIFPYGFSNKYEKT